MIADSAPLEIKYPNLAKLIRQLVYPDPSIFTNPLEEIYGDLPKHLISKYMDNRLLSLPYWLLDSQYIDFINALSLSYGHQVLTTHIARPENDELYHDKKWTPHGSMESCIYIISLPNPKSVGEHQAIFIVYGIMSTLSVLVMSLKKEIYQTKFKFCIDASLSQIYNGLNAEDVINRCVNAFEGAIKQQNKLLKSSKKKIALVALREPNFGHHQWNIFSSLIHISEYLLKLRTKDKFKTDSATVLYDPFTNYTSIAEVANYFNLSCGTNENYSMENHGYIIPLDAPIPSYNIKNILTKIYNIKRQENNKKTIVITIKGFKEKYNQSQMKLITAQLILCEIVLIILENTDYNVIVDGVTNSETTGKTKPAYLERAFQRFYKTETNMFKTLLASIPIDKRARISNIIGMTVRKKFTSYCYSDFSLSISAHSTIAISLMAGTPTLDISTKEITESSVKTWVYPYAKNVGANNLAFITFDSKDKTSSILSKVKSELMKYLYNTSEYIEENSFSKYLIKSKP